MIVSPTATFVNIIFAADTVRAGERMLVRVAPYAAVDGVGPDLSAATHGPIVADLDGTDQPEIVSIVYDYDELGVVDRIIRVVQALSIKLAQSKGGFPSKATVLGAGAINTGADGVVEETGVSTLVPGETLYTSVLAYEAVAAGGVEGLVLAKAKVLFPIGPTIETMGATVDRRDGSVEVRIEISDRTLSLRYVTAIGASPTWPTKAAVEAGIIVGTIADPILEFVTLSFVPDTVLPGQRFLIRAAPYAAVDGIGPGGLATEHGVLVADLDGTDQPEVTSIEFRVTDAGVVNLLIRTAQAKSIKWEKSTSAFPTPVTPENTDSEGIVELSSIQTLVTGETLFIAVLAYEAMNQGGAVGTVEGRAKYLYDLQPEVFGIAIEVDALGVASIQVRTNKTKSIKWIENTTGFVSKATVRAETADLVTDQFFEEAGYRTLAAGQTSFISMLAFEAIGGGGVEGPVLSKRQVSFEGVSSTSIPRAAILSTIQTLTDETFDLKAFQGPGGTSSLEVKWRTQVSGAPFSGFSIFFPAPKQVTITRDPRLTTILECVARDTGSGNVESFPIQYQLRGAEEYADDAGNLNRARPFGDGDFAVRASVSDGLKVTAAVVEDGGKAVNRLYAKALAADPDTADSVAAGVATRVVTNNEGTGAGRAFTGLDAASKLITGTVAKTVAQIDDGVDRAVTGLSGTGEITVGSAAKTVAQIDDGVSRATDGLDATGQVEKGIQFGERLMAFTVQENHNVATGTVSLQRVTAVSLPTRVTGFAGGAAGRIIVLFKQSNPEVVLRHLNTNSLDANRIRLPLSEDYSIGTNQAVWLHYDAADASGTGKWRIMGIRSKVKASFVEAGQFGAGDFTFPGDLTVDGDLTIGGKIPTVNTDLINVAKVSGLAADVSWRRFFRFHKTGLAENATHNIFKVTLDGTRRSVHVRAIGVYRTLAGFLFGRASGVLEVTIWRKDSSVIVVEILSQLNDGTSSDRSFWDSISISGSTATFRWHIRDNGTGATTEQVTAFVEVMDTDQGQNTVVIA